jgi:hypothetical protein
MSALHRLKKTRSRRSGFKSSRTEYVYLANALIKPLLLGLPHPVAKS